MCTSLCFGGDPFAENLDYFGDVVIVVMERMYVFYSMVLPICNDVVICSKLMFCFKACCWTKMHRQSIQFVLNMSNL